MNARFCEHCGAKLPSDAVFCEVCGAKVAVDTMPAAPAQPQVYQQPIQTQRYQPPVMPPKKSGSKIGIIILVVVLLAAAAVAVLWFAGVIGGEKVTPNTPPTKIAQSSENLETPPGEIAQPSKTPKPLKTSQTPSVSSEPENEDSPGANGESMQLSTTETPTAEDFDWFTGKAERWVYGITPADAYTLEDFYALLGSWKGLQMIYDYDGTVLGYGYFTATFAESGSNVAATLDWHFIDWTDGSHEDLTNRQNESMTGSFAAPTLALGEAGNSIELIVYAMDGKQYAEGVWAVQSGEEVRVALMRP